ncbi:MAG: exodeoxyribonuclease VII small subunit [Clostridia bacterium]|nr:exodeoxyribonuclease VII small subunit [Clostridia bacterium]
MAEKNKENDATGKLSFEDAMNRLEEIVRRLESGDVPLDDSLGLFEEGVKLVKQCNGMLDAVQKKISLITGNGEEEIDADSVGK